MEIERQALLTGFLVFAVIGGFICLIYIIFRRIYRTYMQSQLQHADDEMSREYDELQKDKDAVLHNQSEISDQQARDAVERLAREDAERLAREDAERLAREDAERLAREDAQQVNEETERRIRDTAESLARETAEHRAMEEAELQIYREAVLRKQVDVERQENPEIDNRNAFGTPERVMQDKSSSHYQSSRQWPKVSNKECAKTNVPSSSSMVHSQVTAPKVSKSSSHYETSKDWPVVEQTESERKGFAFERFVDTHFPNKFFKRLEWRSDIKDTDGRLSENSKYPDLEYEIRKSCVRFAVECKWRQGFLKKDGKQIIWWARDEKQITNYVQYGKRQNLDVIVIIGIGGTPDEPDKVYSMPLSKLDSPYITKDELWNYFVGKQVSYFFVPEDHNIRLYNKK